MPRLDLSHRSPPASVAVGFELGHADEPVSEETLLVSAAPIHSRGVTLALRILVWSGFTATCSKARLPEKPALGGGHSIKNTLWAAAEPRLRCQRLQSFFKSLVAPRYGEAAVRSSSTPARCCSSRLCFQRRVTVRCYSRKQVEVIVRSPCSTRSTEIYGGIDDARWWQPRSSVWNVIRRAACFHASEIVTESMVLVSPRG